MSPLPNPLTTPFDTLTPHHPVARHRPVPARIRRAAHEAVSSNTVEAW